MLACLDLGLFDPTAQGLRVDPELLTDAAEYRLPTASLDLVHRQADRSLAQLVGVLLVCWHALHPSVAS